MIIGAKTRVVEPAITVVELSGHLNLGNNLVSIEGLLKRLIAEGSRKLVIDLTELTYIDSAGVGMLVSANGQMDAVGGRLILAGSHGSPAKILDMVHMNKIVRLEPDADSACKHLASGGAAAS
jgi:anti-anti-sigma factor